MTVTVEERRTRRELVGWAAAGAAAVGLIGGEAAAAAGAPGDDTDVLRRTLLIDQLVVIAYRKALGAGVLVPQVAAKVRAILGQELEHVAILERALRSLGALPPPPPRDLTAAQRALTAHHVTTSLTDLHTQKQCLKLLIDVETLAEDAYFVAVGNLSDAALLRTCAEIMGSEAQHWTVLSSARHHGDVMMSVPYPFVGGPL